MVYIRDLETGASTMDFYSRGPWGGRRWGGGGWGGGGWGGGWGGWGGCDFGCDECGPMIIPIMIIILILVGKYPSVLQ